jgi:16S rRNA (guanine966-N2)-methyltransferase
MRITGGNLRSRTLDTGGLQGARPTTDRARETVFNIARHHCNFTGARVLDLCAGSGALGFEALSRGAGRAVFVEKSRQNCAVIARNAASLGVEDLSLVVCDDAERWLARQQRETRAQALPTSDQSTAAKLLPEFDCVFCDPPYAARFGQRLFSALQISGAHAEGTLFIVEHDARERIVPPHDDNDEGALWTKLTERVFGETIIEFYQRER